jgi:DNA-binding XRE family transcriptional regulator
LGYDPFTDPSLGRPKGNETPFVAILSSSPSAHLARELRERRIAMRKTRMQCAKEIGISYKTLVSLEMNRRQPTEATRQRIEAFFKMKRVQVRT